KWRRWGCGLGPGALSGGARARASALSQATARAMRRGAAVAASVASVAVVSVALAAAWATHLTHSIISSARMEVEAMFVLRRPGQSDFTIARSARRRALTRGVVSSRQDRCPGRSKG